MTEPFGARARRFLGWYTPENMEDDQEFYAAAEDFAEVTPLPSVRHETPTHEVSEKYSEASPAPQLSRIVTVHPDSYADALSIAESFRQGLPVILNLTKMSDEEARRMIDFAAGLTFGLHGVIERVTPGVFLLSPRTVEVSGDFGGTPRRSMLFNQG
ncbi:MULTISPECIES: cell division protein SepF [unclassified Schaalia]|uniref:cell division protein SepF n=1 Tax=unclassified Schaalia TaxID=2691889 RepID=UPI001E3DE1F7|nr:MULTISPECIES: cell division protein SepF [unclassified Schaalia]MCD4549248.1 cell division protein SepF [Schaalia sp. lx-260]MCD4557057.1 cell division protein SepF [Schaalia sp. lx-100]